MEEIVLIYIVLSPLCLPAVEILTKSLQLEIFQKSRQKLTDTLFRYCGGFE